jgi:hypothetical protein
VHVLALPEVPGIVTDPETITVTSNDDGLDLLVTHDLCTFVTLLLKPNGYVLEQPHSPLVVAGGRQRLRPAGRWRTRRPPPGGS